MLLLELIVIENSSMSHTYIIIMLVYTQLAIHTENTRPTLDVYVLYEAVDNIK